MVFHVYGIYCDKDILDVVKLEKSVTASQVFVSYINIEKHFIFLK